MPSRKVFLEDMGEVTLIKRRGNKNLRLSVNAKGRIRVSMPLWSPYGAGVLFVQKNKAWVAQRVASTKANLLGNGDKIGKNHTLIFIFDQSMGAKVRTRIVNGSIRVISTLPASDPAVQQKAAEASERALKAEASQLLPQRLAALADKHGLRFSGVKIKKLSSRWGSCSERGDITLNSYLMQLPWHLIDYVLLHELVHTIHKHHGPDFWTGLEEILPSAKHLRKQLKQHQPRLEAQLTNRQE